MPFVSVQNTVMVELRYLSDLQHIENTLYFERADAPTPTNIGTLLDAVESWWLDNIQPLIPNVLVLTEIVGTDLTTATGPQVAHVPAGGGIGGVADPPLPNNVSIAISFRTGLRGRAFRGRNYHPSLWETGVTKNTLQEEIVTAIQDAYIALVGHADVVAAGYEWVVVSRFSGVDGDGDPIPRAAGVTTPVLTALIVDPTVDSQRRRLPGRGR